MLLLIGDLHLTDQARDAYRFGIFEWVREQQKKYKPTATLFMGDLTDRKDKHSSSLVNRTVNALYSLETPVYIIKGNHDYIDEGEPFFGFLHKIEGIELVSEPRKFAEMYFIPHTRSETEFAKACAKVTDQKYLFLHQTIAGAIAETGAPLTGFSASPIEALPRGVAVYAGDVHKPQRAGRVTYVGSPYTIRFGDDFEPRCLLLKGDGTTKNLYFDCPYKWKLTIRSVDDLERHIALAEGDQVKITIELVREEAVEAKTYMREVREFCKLKGLELFGIEVKVNSLTKKPNSTATKAHQTPEEIILSYSKAEGLSSAVRKTGLSLLKGQNEE